MHQEYIDTLPLNNTGIILYPRFAKSLLWLLLFFVAFMAASVLYAIGCGIYWGATGAVSDPDMISMLINKHMQTPLGMTLSYGLITVVLLPLVIWAANFKISPWQQTLALHHVAWKKIGFWMLVYAVLALIQTIVIKMLDVDSGRFVQSILGTKDLGLLLVFVVLAPVLEELVFRGYLFKAWRHSFLGLWGTLLLTSVLFTSLHAAQYPIELLISLFCFSLVLGLAREYTGSIYTSIVLHSINNLLAWITIVFLGLA